MSSRVRVLSFVDGGCVLGFGASGVLKRSPPIMIPTTLANTVSIISLLLCVDGICWIAFFVVDLTRGGRLRG